MFRMLIRDRLQLPTYQLRIVTITDMEPQTRSNHLLLSDLFADLILEAEDVLHDLIQRAEQNLDDLELALDISAFSQHQYTVSKGCSTSQPHKGTSIFTIDIDSKGEGDEMDGDD
jgi:hypothetical protein